MFVVLSASIKATISNIGAIQAILFLGLRTNIEFRIEFSTYLVDDGGNDKSNSISFINNSVLGNKSHNQSNFSATSSMKSISIDHSEQEKQHNQQETVLVYRFTITENSTNNFSLVFKSRKVNEDSFELAITMMKIDVSSTGFVFYCIHEISSFHILTSNFLVEKNG